MNFRLGKRTFGWLGTALGAGAFSLTLISGQSVPTQADAADAPGATEESQEDPAIEPFRGPLEQGIAAMRDLAETESIAAAETFAQRLLQPGSLDRLQETLRGFSSQLGPRVEHGLLASFEWLGLASRSLPQRAVVHYDLGRLQVQHEALEPARESFQQAVFLDSGPARRAGLYNLGWLELQDAETLFDQIPEVHGRTRSAMGPGFVPSQHSGEEEEPDYLQLSRKKYQAALEHFIERLRIDWQHADTRANVEWIQNRLETLREIENKRKSDDGQGMADDEPSENPQDQQEDPQEDGGQQGAKSEQENAPEPPQDNQEGPEGESGEENQNQDRDDSQEESEQRKDENESEDPADEDLEERLLTEEEIKRLLKNLEQHDKEGERLRQLVRPRPRGGVKKDW